jgi:hypothetical protein
MPSFRICASLVRHDKQKMSPELHFILFLLLRMAIAAAFVVTASIITERSGPVTRCADRDPAGLGRSVLRLPRDRP